MYHHKPCKTYQIFNQVPNYATLSSPSSKICTAPPETAIFITAIKHGRMLHQPPQTSMTEEGADQNDQEHVTYDKLLESLPEYVKRMIAKDHKLQFSKLDIKCYRFKGLCSIIQQFWHHIELNYQDFQHLPHLQEHN
eukprot:3028864-Ditylum_brightwellii.AAC.1